MADYHTDWCREHTTQFKLRLNNNTDADIINWLKEVPNKQGYIKELIRADIYRVTNIIVPSEAVKEDK